VREGKTEITLGLGVNPIKNRGLQKGGKLVKEETNDTELG